MLSESPVEPPPTSLELRREHQQEVLPPVHEHLALLVEFDLSQDHLGQRRRLPQVLDHHVQWVPKVSVLHFTAARSREAGSRLWEWVEACWWWWWWWWWWWEWVEACWWWWWEWVEALLLMMMIVMLMKLIAMVAMATKKHGLGW